MNFDDAIQAHAAWKIKLATYLDKKDGSLGAPEVRADNGCQLGQWLYGEGRKYSSMTEYKTLIGEHALFHRAAGDVIDQANSGRQLNADNILHSEYGIASRNVVMAIMDLKRKVKAA